MAEIERSLTKSLSAELRTNGHVLIRQVMPSDEISESQHAIAAVVKRLRPETRPLTERSTYDKAFLQITNLWQKDESVKHFVFEKKFAQIAADLLGVENVRLYHDQALFKEPGGGHTPWHQDKYYWPLDTEAMVTMWMPLVDIDESMGTVAFASASHANGAVDNVEISDESEALYDRYISASKFPIETTSIMKAGDATFHLGWTIHRAGPNRSDKMREAMTIIYFADGARVTKPNGFHQEADLNAWLGGRQPGDLADSYLNPILN